VDRMKMTTLSRFSRWPSLFIAAVLLCFSPSGFAESVANGGFEKWQDGLPLGWTDTTTDGPSNLIIKQVKEGAPAGKSCLQLSDAWAADYRECYGLESKEPIALTPGTRYVFSMQYRNNAGVYPWTNIVAITITGPEVTKLSYVLRPAARLRWKQYRYLLPAIPDGYDAATLAIGLAGATSDLLRLDDVTLKPATSSQLSRYAQPRRGARIAAIPAFKSGDKGEATGFIHRQYMQNAWWLVGPEGQRLWSIGCSVPKKGRKASRKEVKRSLHEWGFNTFAAGSETGFLKDAKKGKTKKQAATPVFVSLDLPIPKPEVRLRDRNGDSTGRSPMPMADPYNPDWRKAVLKEIAKVTAKGRDNPWLGGYLAGGYLWLEKLPYRLWGKYSGAEFVKWLEKKYANDIAKLNKKWCAQEQRAAFASFAELAERKAEPSGYDDPAYKDFKAFARVLLDEYIGFVIKAFREADPNHMVISFTIGAEQVMEMQGYLESYNAFDAISLHISPRANVAGFEGGELSVILKTHLGTRRPLLITGLAISAMDSGIYTPPYRLISPVLDALPDQTARAAVYRGCLSQLGSLPYVLGVHWASWADTDLPVFRYNGGLVNKRGKPYAELVETMKGIHSEVVKKKGLVTSD